MYHPNQSPSARRAGEEFLRRMTQNDLQKQESTPVFQQNGSCCELQRPNRCNASETKEMPSLAMVYAPVQEWSCLMDTPEMALAHGTLFKELFKPFEGRGNHRSAKC